MSQAALHRPPVHRRLLAGDDPLRLRASALWPIGVLAVLGASVGIWPVLMWAEDGWPLWLTPVAAAALAVLASAASARWIGERRALIAGIVLAVLPAGAGLAGGRAISQPGPTLLGLSVLLAVGSFALANIPGRRALIGGNRLRWAFHLALASTVALGGCGGTIPVLGPVLLVAAWRTDSRAFRWLAFPPGMAVSGLAVLIGAGWTGPVDGASWSERLTELAVAGMPWWPIALATIAVGVARGHDATPFWQLIGTWLLLVAALLTLGLLPLGGATIIHPPLAMISAAGLHAVANTGWRAVNRPTG